MDLLDLLRLEPLKDDYTRIIKCWPNDNKSKDLRFNGTRSK